ILTSGQLTLGHYGSEFEQAFAERTGRRFGIAVNSGTSALEIALRCIGVKGHNAVVPTNTFFATPASVIHAGGDVVFTDIDEHLCMDGESLEHNIDKRTKAVIVVHIGGLIAPQIHHIQEICEEKGIWLIEDAAHAHGSSYRGTLAGGFGDIGCFSFYPTKVITSVEGGLIVTDDPEVDAKARVLRDQGKGSFHANRHTEMGNNWRMSELHAAVGLSQLRRLDEFIRERREVAALYTKELGSLKGIDRISIPGGADPNYYKYVLLLEGTSDRGDIKKRMKEKHEVSLSGEVYELPCHKQPVFANLPSAMRRYPRAEDLCARHICLPVYPRMTEEETMHVIESMREVMRCVSG
ncbi:MAG: DegT/DnrJ/EryC1/StrS family aminotransferase, partial [Deltaproteobacteria bacterium]|nr:DegT/DnrJ/EryC1/StrS family aminotransferase [Deltaproteobacteria bacterium]